MFIMGNSITCITNCNHTTGVTVYTLKTCFFFKFISVSTLHVGDNGGGYCCC